MFDDRGRAVRALLLVLGLGVWLGSLSPAQVPIPTPQGPLPPWRRPQPPPPPVRMPAEDGPPRISQDPVDKELSGKYFVFVDYDYIFTLELVDKNLPILNFANITDQRLNLSPAHIQLFRNGRRFPVRFLIMDTGVDNQSITIPSTKMYAHSSFGYALKGDFTNLEKLDKVVIKLGENTLELASVSKNDFELLAAKINRVNLTSPDIRDDYRVLRIDRKGKRTRKEEGP